MLPKAIEHSHKDHVINEEVRRKIQAAIGEYNEFPTLVKKRKLRWFGNVSMSSGLAKLILSNVSMSSGLAKLILQGTMKEEKRMKR